MPFACPLIFEERGNVTLSQHMRVDVAVLIGQKINAVISGVSDVDGCKDPSYAREGSAADSHRFLQM